MTPPTDIRAQLKSLTIPKDQRPVESAPSARSGKRSALPGFLIGALVLSALAVALFYARERIGFLLESVTGGGEQGVKLVPVINRQGHESPPLLTATGKIVSDHQVRVSTKVSGQIVALHFEQGDRVTEGQVLARIEDVNYRARRDQAAAQCAKSQANLAFQKTNFDRMLRLHETQNAPDIEFADAQRAMEEAEAEVAASKAALDFAQKALTDCEVRAPIAGVILERNVEVGDFVAAEAGRGAQANAEFGSIADMTTLRVEVDISELDIARVRKDLPCVVIPDAYKDRRYQGHVLWIDPGANYSKATVQAKVRIENPDHYLRVEGSAQVVFLPQRDSTAEASSAPTIWIPSAACLADAAGKTARVFVADGNRLKETSVRLGRRAGSEVEVLGGLSAGHYVAVEEVEKLRDGQHIGKARTPTR